MKRAFSVSDIREALEDGIVPSTMRRVKSQDNVLKAAGQAANDSYNASRVPVLSERELREHFNMPLNEVAKKYGMCTTALKKLCRKYGVMQWPHRKLRSLEKKIASLRAEQRYTTDGHGHLDDEIRKLESQREALISGNGEAGDEEGGGGGAWSPAAMSPVDVSEFGEYTAGEGGGAGPDGGGGLAAHGGGRGRAGGQSSNVQSRATTVGSDWGGEGGSGSGGQTWEANDERLQQHIQTLEEENTSLRALSRSLMKERQELLTKTSASNMEVTNLRQMCETLQRQLRQLGESGGNKAMAVAVNDVEAMMMEHKTRTVHDAGATAAGGVRGGSGGSGSGAYYAHGGGEEMARAESGGMMQAQWQHVGEAGASQGNPSVGPQEESDMHALSWMAPDFDLDELL